MLSCPRDSTGGYLPPLLNDAGGGVDCYVALSQNSYDKPVRSVEAIQREHRGLSQTRWEQCIPRDVPVWDGQKAKVFAYHLPSDIYISVAAMKVPQPTLKMPPK